VLEDFSFFNPAVLQNLIFETSVRKEGNERKECVNQNRLDWKWKKRSKSNVSKIIHNFSLSFTKSFFVKQLHFCKEKTEFIGLKGKKSSTSRIYSFAHESNGKIKNSF
jgi:hypothetical protein